MHGNGYKKSEKKAPQQAPVAIVAKLKLVVKEKAINNSNRTQIVHGLSKRFDLV